MNREEHNKITTDHGRIKQWVTERKGRPVVVKATKTTSGPKQEMKGVGLLRVDFGETDDELEEVPWDEFFRIFDENNLAFLYEEKTKGGEISRFYKFVRR